MGSGAFSRRTAALWAIARGGRIALWSGARNLVVSLVNIGIAPASTPRWQWTRDDDYAPEDGVPVTVGLKATDYSILLRDSSGCRVPPTSEGARWLATHESSWEKPDLVFLDEGPALGSAGKSIPTPPLRRVTRSGLCCRRIECLEPSVGRSILPWSSWTENYPVGRCGFPAPSR